MQYLDSRDNYGLVSSPFAQVHEGVEHPAKEMLFRLKG